MSYRALLKSVKARVNHSIEMEARQAASAGILASREGGRQLPKTQMLNDRRSRPALVVVTEWPSGTMAIKLGDAIRRSLDVGREAMRLVQLQPERIFRVETAISEAAFRSSLGRHDVSCPGPIIFVELEREAADSTPDDLPWR